MLFRSREEGDDVVNVLAAAVSFLFANDSGDKMQRSKGAGGTSSRGNKIGVKTLIYVIKSKCSDVRGFKIKEEYSSRESALTGLLDDYKVLSYNAKVFRTPSADRAAFDACLSNLCE